MRQAETARDTGSLEDLEKVMLLQLIMGMYVLGVSLERPPVPVVTQFKVVSGMLLSATALMQTEPDSTKNRPWLRVTVASSWTVTDNGIVDRVRTPTTGPEAQGHISQRFRGCWLSWHQPSV